MSRAVRLALAGTVAVFAIVPLAPAHASVCNPAFQPVCDQLEALCQGLEKYPVLHHLLCEFG
jgi:hypothetical protein